jgi:hypothetical protein
MTVFRDFRAGVVAETTADEMVQEIEEFPDDEEG